MGVPHIIQVMDDHCSIEPTMVTWGSPILRTPSIFHGWIRIESPKNPIENHRQFGDSNPIKPISIPCMDAPIPQEQQGAADRADRRVKCAEETGETRRTRESCATKMAWSKNSAKRQLFSNQLSSFINPFPRILKVLNGFFFADLLIFWRPKIVGISCDQRTGLSKKRCPKLRFSGPHLQRLCFGVKH